MLERFFKKKEGRPYTSAVLAAAGAASRMEGINKLLVELDGIPVAAYALLALEHCGFIDEIVVASSEENLLPLTEICRQFEISKASKIIRGGASRAESVYKALCECSPQARFALVQDGARPFVTPELIQAVCEKAYAFQCATAATPVKDTVKVVEGGFAVHTPDRASLYAVQTPQATDIDLLKAALVQALEKGETTTDDCAAVERLHIRPAIVPGFYENIKITTPEDLDIAQALLERMR